jgi:serine/threonine-protein kinase
MPPSSRWRIEGRYRDGLSDESWRVIRYEGADASGPYRTAELTSGHLLAAGPLDGSPKAAFSAYRLQRAYDALLHAQGAGVPRAFEIGTSVDGRPYMITEIVEGERLEEILARAGRLTLSAVARLLVSMAPIVDRMHAAGVVHRDMGPRAMVLARGEPQVTHLDDFGVATFQIESAATSAERPMLGTPYFMSPEQCQGFALDARSDLWSLGVIAFLCATGRQPYAAPSLGDLLVAVIVQPPPPPSRFAPVPAAFDGWFFRANAKDPRQRFSSAQEMASALEQVVIAQPS